MCGISSCVGHPSNSNNGKCAVQDVNAERSHWGLWCIVSSPLVLGFDMNISATMDRVWPIITNTEALAVNHNWAGKPGTLAKVYPMAGLAPVIENWCTKPGPDGDTGCGIGFQVGFSPSCDGSADQIGWKLDGGMLVAPADGQAGDQCVTTHNYQYDVDCPPPTSTSGPVGCGTVIMNCSRAKADGSWALDTGTGLLKFAGSVPSSKPACLSATPFAFDAGKNVRQGWKVSVGGCPTDPSKPVANSSKFRLTTKGELVVGGSDGSSAACLTAVPLNGPQLWTKPLADGRIAVVVVNPMVTEQSFALPLADVPGLSGCGGASGCAVRDVWNHADASHLVSAGHVAIVLGPNDCVFYVLGGTTAAADPVAFTFPGRVPTSSMKIDDAEAAFRPPTEPRILQGETDWAAFLSRSDPINTFNISEPMTVPDIWLESAFLGNGMIGCQVLVCPGGICTQSLLLGTNTTLPSLDAPHQVVIPLARADVADTRTGNASAACTEFHGKVNCFNLADQYARPRLGIGALILRQTSGKIIGGSIRTNLHNASISARIRTTQGDVEFNAFIHATRQLLVVRGLRGSGGERHTQLRFDFVPAPAVSPVQFEAKRTAGAFTRFTGSPLPGHYAPNPPASCSNNSCRQSLLVSREGRGWVTSWRSGSGGQLLLTVTSDIPVRVGIAPKTTRASTEAASVLAAAAALDPSALVAEHSSWWAHLYWSDSSGAFVSLPAAAAKVEQFHWITLLKVASENACRRFVDSAFPPGILDNCLLLDGLNFVGPMQKTKYPFAIWDMNVQGAQWGSHSSNLPEQSLALARRIPEQLSNFIASVPRDMRNDSASINVETASLSFLAECMVRHCDSDAFPLCVNNFSAVQDLPDEACLQHSGSLVPQNFYGGLPWVCHSIWLVYRHTMDESILRDLLPLLKRSTTLYIRTAHVGADEKLHLPLMESPEYGEAADTSFDHALFRWCLRTLIHTSTLLPNSSTDLEVQKWQNALRKLSAPRIDPTTGSLMIGANLSLHSSNKHFSHLFSIFPLGLQDWSVEAERELWTKSLAVFKHYNDPTVSDEGFTYLGMAIITAWARPALPGGAPASWADSVLGNISHFFRVPQLGSGTMYADHAACGPVAGCREGMAGPCNESPILASLALQQMLLQSWNGVPIGIFPAVSASWADARFARMRAEGAVLVAAVRANFTTIFFSLNATVGGNVSVHSTIVDLASANAEVMVTASSSGEAGVFAVSVSHPEPWAAVFYSKARGPPTSEELGLALTPLPAGEVNLWGSRPAGSGPPIPPGPPPPGPLGPLPPCPASGCAHCGGCRWPYANDTLPDPKQPVLSSVVATTVACEAKCGSMAAPRCAGFTRKDADEVCYFYSKSQVSGLFSHLRPDVSWHPNPHAETRVD